MCPVWWWDLVLFIRSYSFLRFFSVRYWWWRLEREQRDHLSMMLHIIIHDDVIILLMKFVYLLLQNLSLLMSKCFKTLLRVCAHRLCSRVQLVFLRHDAICFKTLQSFCGNRWIMMDLPLIRSHMVARDAALFLSVAFFLFLFPLPSPGSCWPLP
jgi:hypothetical protein